MTPKQHQHLANKIATYIHDNDPVTWEQLVARAEERSIPPRDFLAAMEYVHNRVDIYGRELKGGITYSKKTQTKRTPRYDATQLVPYPTPLCWVCNAPLTTATDKQYKEDHIIASCKQCAISFTEPEWAWSMDFSYMVLTPEEHMKKYGCTHTARTGML